MSLPRCSRTLAKHSLVLQAVLFATGAGTALAAQDTATARPADSTNARTDTTLARPDTAAGQNGMRPDSVRADSLRRDTAAARTAAPDTAAQAGGAAAPAAAPAAPPAPVDSALAVACRATGGDPPDLLTVVFRATATAAEREGVARQVGGTLLEPSRHQAPGAWYLQVPNSAIDPTVAERVIVLPPVLEVSATRCP